MQDVCMHQQKRVGSSRLVPNGAFDGGAAPGERAGRARKSGWIALLCGLGTTLVGLTGCQAPGVIFEPQPADLRWPAPPEPARIRYVGQLETSADLKPGRSFGQGFVETLVGAPDARSMLSPFAVCTDGAGRLFVSDTNAQVVHVFDLESRAYAEWRPQGGFAQPVGVAIDGRGRLLVSDSVAGCLYAFGTDGEFLGPIGSDFLERPCGLVVDPRSQRILVTDSASHSLVVLDADGGLIERIGGRGTELGRFNYPTNVAIGQDGRVFVADTLNSRVQVFDADLQPVGEIGGRGDMPGNFSQPKGVALDSEDHLYVVDAHFEIVQVFDREGQLLLALGGEGRGPGQFWLPAGIHIDANDRIWIADSYNRRVQVLDYLREAGP